MTFTPTTTRLKTTPFVSGINSSATLKTRATAISGAMLAPLNADAVHFSQKTAVPSEEREFKKNLQNILTAFNTNDPEMHLQAFETLNTMDDSERLKVLEMALSHHNPDVRSEAVCHVLSLENPQNRERFVYLALMSEDKSVYSEAPYLIDAIDGPKKQAQFEAIVLNSFDSIQALLTLQKHTDLSPTELNTQLLKKSLQSNSASVRSMALKTLKNFNDGSFITTQFLELINTNPHNERQKALQEIRHLHKHPAVQAELLATLVKSENPGISLTALSLLPVIPASFPLLNEVIDSILAEDGTYTFNSALIDNLVKRVASQDERENILRTHAANQTVDLSNSIHISVLSCRTEQQICELLHIISEANNPNYFHFSRPLIYKLNDNGLRRFWTNKFPKMKPLTLTEQVKIGFDQMYQAEFSPEMVYDFLTLS